VTTRANDLTLRATGRSASDRRAPLQPVAQLRVFVRVLTHLGFDTSSLLKRAGLRPAELEDPDALVPLSVFDVVLCGAVEENRIPNLGAHLAFHTPMGAFPLLDYLVLTSDTVGDALRQLQRYFHTTSAPCTLEIVEDEQFVRLIVQPGSDLFTALYQTGIVLHHLRDETRQRLRVTYVSLMREPEDRRDLERLLGCPVRAPATWSGMEFSRLDARLPLRRRDPVLRAVLEGRLHEAPSGASTTAVDSTAVQVRALLAARIGSDQPDVGRVARQLHISPRTLQRRLAAEGASFKELVDGVRREAAERLIADGSLSVSEVAYLLGFSEPSAFHRAFKRWVGVSPSDYRRARGPEPDA
jgi:AraC-like DNA-binding protein